MVRGRDVCWEHCVLVDATKQKVRCNYCQREFSGGVYRMKFHLAQIKNKDIVPCIKVPNDVSNHIRGILSTPKKLRARKKQKSDDQVANGQESSSSSSQNSHANNHNYSAQREGSTSQPSHPHQASPGTNQDLHDAQKHKKENADIKVATFFVHNSIPFSAAKSIYYQEMVDAIAECGIGYKGPSHDLFGSTLLDKMKSDICSWHSKCEDEWKEYGCSVLCDSWSGPKNKSLVAFTVTCPKGAVFLKSVDVSGHEDDGTYLFELLESVVLEIGVENVVQVITDSTASYIYAGSLLMAKYITLFCVPCASCCINQMLEDMSKLDWVCSALEEADTIIQYVHSNASVLQMLQKFTGGKGLIRPRIAQFVSSFLSLRAIVSHEEDLKQMCRHNEWGVMVSSHNDSQAFKSLVFSERFWRTAQEVVNVSDPLIKILRLVDGDFPSMGYLYEGMERVKMEIKVYYYNVEERYMPIWGIIHRRWNVQLLSPLHAAAAFLNPCIFYNPKYKFDHGIRNGFQEAMKKLATSDEDKIKVTVENPVYISAQGALGTDFAIMGRRLNSPGMF